MDKERFEALYETARAAAGVKGSDLSLRSLARRQLRQTLDLLSMEAEPHQWAAVEWARKNGYPPFDIVVKQKGL